MISYKEFITEKLMVFGKSAYPKFGHVVILAGGAGCYPAGTEFLSQNGWKSIEDYSIGDKVVEVDGQTLNGAFADPVSYIVHDTDQFYQIKNQRMSFTTSVNHTHLLINDKTKKPHTKKTHELFNNHISKSRGNKDCFVNSFNLVTNTRLDYTDDYIRLKIAIFADGSILPQKEPKVKIRIKKQRKIDRLTYLLNVNNIKYTMNKEGDYRIFNFYVDNRDIHFDDFWYSASIMQLRVIADEIFKWDGCYRKNGISSFCSTNKKSADFVQFALASCGYNTNMAMDVRDGRNTCYGVSTSNSNCGISKNSRTLNGINFEKVVESNKMYCFETNTGFFVVRQNGRVFVSGNSGKGYQLKHLLGIEGKVFDVDALKELALKSPKFKAKVMSDLGRDLDSFNLKNPDEVSSLHDIISGIYNIPNKMQQSFFSDILISERKPNLIFDVTLKDLKKLYDISRSVQELGYDKKNIHIVWIVNDIEAAIDQNEKRARTVLKDILIQTHQGVSMTLDTILNMGDGLKQYMDGSIFFSFNKAGVDVTIDKSNDGGHYIKTANYIMVKEVGKPQMSTDDLSDEILSKLELYTPKVKGNLWHKKQ